MKNQIVSQNKLKKEKEKRDQIFKMKKKKERNECHEN